MIGAAHSRECVATFKRKTNGDKTMKTKAWNSHEVDSAITLYLSMRRAVDAGEKYNKAAMIRYTRGIRKPGESVSPGPNFAALQARSVPSVEMKLMNLTSIFESLGRDDLSLSDHGYRPLGNAQKSLLDAVKAAIK